MKDAEFVLEFIDTLYSHAVERPRMYFSSPEAFEDVVWNLEALRDELTEVSGDDDTRTYRDYLTSKEFGSANFTSRYVLDRPSEVTNNDELFKAYSDFLIGYLRDHNRLVTKSE